MVSNFYKKVKKILKKLGFYFFSIIILIKSIEMEKK